MKKSKIVPALVFCSLTMLATTAFARPCCDGNGDRRNGRHDRHDSGFSNSHATGNMDLYGTETRKREGGGTGDCPNPNRK